MLCIHSGVRHCWYILCGDNRLSLCGDNRFPGLSCWGVLAYVFLCILSYVFLAHVQRTHISGHNAINEQLPGCLAARGACDGRCASHAHQRRGEDSGVVLSR